MRIFIPVRQKDNDIPPLRLTETVTDLIDQNALAVIKAGFHRGADHTCLEPRRINKHKSDQNCQHKKENPAPDLSQQSYADRLSSFIKMKSFISFGHNFLSLYQSANPHFLYYIKLKGPLQS